MHSHEFPRSALMLGCAPLGGLYHKDISVDHHTRPTLRRAILTHNIHDIDTAPWYGHGKSESDIGKVLETDPDLAKEIVRIYTKVGRVMKKRSDYQDRGDPRAAVGDTCYKITEENKDVVPFHDYTDIGINESIKQSISRLRILESNQKIRNMNHRLVCLRLHDCDDEERFKEATRFGGISALFRFCSATSTTTAAAPIRLCEPSIGMNEPDRILQLLKWVSSSPDAYSTLNMLPKNRFHSVMMAGCWNLMDQSGMEVMDFCDKHEIEIHNAGIFGAGLLWGKSSHDSATSSNNTSTVNYRYRSATKKEIEKRDKWEAVALEFGVSLPALAIAFAYLPTSVTKICFGATSPQQVDQNVEAADEAMRKLLAVSSNDDGMTTVMHRVILFANKKRLFEDSVDGVVSQCIKWAEKRSKMIGRDHVSKL